MYETEGTSTNYLGGNTGKTRSFSPLGWKIRQVVQSCQNKAEINLTNVSDDDDGDDGDDDVATKQKKSSWPESKLRFGIFICHRFHFKRVLYLLRRFTSESWNGSWSRKAKKVDSRIRFFISAVGNHDGDGRSCTWLLLTNLRTFHFLL